MSLTAVFAELLIVGVQGTVWLFLFILVLFGYEWLDDDLLEALADFPELLFVVYFALAYTLGITIDRIADSTLSFYDKTFRQNYLPGNLPTVPRMRLYLMEKSPTAHTYIDYIRSRMRIARSTMFNLVIIFLAFNLLTVVRLADVIDFNTYISISFSLLFFIGTSFIVWRRIARTYYKRLKRGFKIIKRYDPEYTKI